MGLQNDLLEQLSNALLHSSYMPCLNGLTPLQRIFGPLLYDIWFLFHNCSICWSGSLREMGRAHTISNFAKMKT